MTLYTSDTDIKNRSNKHIVVDSFEVIDEKSVEEEKQGTYLSGTIFPDKSQDILRIALIYMAVSAALGIFGAVYEIFSHGVFSYYMIYAFAIPAILGMIPYMTKYVLDLRNRTGRQHKSTARRYLAGLYHAGIGTLTIGSIMKGVLDIYGTTNRLLLVYPLIGAALIIAALVPEIKGRFTGEEKTVRTHSGRRAPKEQIVEFR